MLYVLPDKISCAQELDFSNAITTPKVRLIGVQGIMIGAKNSTPTLGYKCKKWGQGHMGDKNAHWRKGRGLGHSMVSKKYKTKAAKG